MSGFEQNQGTNFKFKSASRLETERYENLNRGTYTTSENIVQRVIFSGCF